MAQLHITKYTLFHVQWMFGIGIDYILYILLKSDRIWVHASLFHTIVWIPFIATSVTV